MRICFLLLTLLSFDVEAWGPLGHRVVAQLAQNRLTPTTKARLALILGKDELVDVANWADMVRSDEAWRKADPWHYVSVEDGKSYDPKTASKDGDVIWAIEKFAADLSNPKTQAQQKREAVAFLVHFLGDLHQPLHVGRAGDKGGNTIELKWFGKTTNLHHVWDEELLSMEQLSYTEYARFIDKASDEQKKAWEKTPLLGQAEESQALRDVVYSFPSARGKYWEYQYRYKVLPLAHQRLQQAGVRLAALLNGILAAKARK